MEPNKLAANTKLLKVVAKDEMELLIQSAKKLFSELSENEIIQPLKSAKIALEAKNIEELLEKYLTELIKLSMQKKMKYSQFRVKLNEKTLQDGTKIILLEGVVFGEKLGQKNSIEPKIGKIKIIRGKKETNAEFELIL
jgi:SHS2 domain-containing protein